MATKTHIPLTTPVSELAGVGPARAEALRGMGIRCAADLILHLPMRYEHDLGEHSIADAGKEVTPIHGATATLAVRGEVLTSRLVRARKPRKQRFEATLFDGTGTVLLTWFNSQWLDKQIHPGMNIRAWGKAKRHGDYLQLVNPRWEIISVEEDVEALAERLKPVYPASENITSSQIESVISEMLEQALESLEDHLQQKYREEKAMPTLAEAYRMVHKPNNDDEVLQGRRRLAFDELLMLELGVMLKRAHRRSTLRAIPLKATSAIDKHILARFPFELTASQRVVVKEIAADLQHETPMNRLLQGDVGSGKTVVALYATLLAIASNHQSAILAPTELLAEQHLSTITGMLEGSKVSIELLTGSLSKSAREEVLNKIETGETDLVIGTHALLTEGVSFKSLAVAVIDEQHRFGVHQRAVLRSRSADSDLTAHILVMTATPIPRTMSLTVFGDLDVSTIHGLPPGRIPIATRVVGQEKEDEVYEYAAKKIKQGEQVYIVVPVIDESDSGLKDVNTHLERLSNTQLAGCRLEAMHGRLKQDEREEIMSRFRIGEIDALVATTVIEVGVDVPNATMMIIEHADRFGLAQLHQLRGRVGRSSKRSVCVLLGTPVTEDGKARLEAIGGTTDGFQIAEKDLEIRGPGELFGTKQSGLPPFRVAELPRDVHLLDMARRDAQAWIERDQVLANEKDALLRKRLMKAYGESLGLGDVA